MKIGIVSNTRDHMFMIEKPGTLCAAPPFTSRDLDQRLDGLDSP